MDALLMSRIQFASTAVYHYLFVPLSIGFGLVLALLVTRAYRSQDPHDDALATMWLRLFAGTFAVGVATGLTMEFSFGTNWADYSRFVGDIFGAPLAAEALLAFFMESVFLGVLIWGKKKVSPKAYMASAWIVWLGSCFSALWIIIANSWMQTPAGYEVIQTEAGPRAVLTDFFAAAFNASTLERYFHVICALVIVGGLAAIAVAAYYMLKNRNEDLSKKLMKTGLIVAIVGCVFMAPAAQQQAVEVTEEQPAKLAAMEGQWESGPSEMSFFGWVDEENQVTYTIGIPGGTSFLASGSFDTVYPGLNDFDEDYYPGNVNAIYQSYHMMLYMLGVIGVVIVLALLISLGKLRNGVTLRVLLVGWIAGLVAIECGWLVAELGRQPWIVYGELSTADAVSGVVDPWMLVITLLLFAVIYIAIYALWLRASFKIIKKGPEAFFPGAQADPDDNEDEFGEASPAAPAPAADAAEDTKEAHA